LKTIGNELKEKKRNIYCYRIGFYPLFLFEFAFKNKMAFFFYKQILNKKEIIRKVKQKPLCLTV